MSLAQIQALFWQTITQDTPPAADFLVTRPDAPADARLAIYRNMYTWRIVDVLREDFANLLRFLGDEAFIALCHRYLAAHPSTDPSIARVGQHMADFLRCDSTLGAHDILASLADLEWLRGVAFADADTLPIGMEQLAQQPPDTITQLQLQFAPGLHVLSSEYDIAPLWHALEHDEEVTPPAQQPTVIAVWRTDFHVYHATLDPAAAKALQAAMGGAPFGAVCGCFADLPDAEQAAGMAVARWFADGWVTGVAAMSARDA